MRLGGLERGERALPLAVLLLVREGRGDGRSVPVSGRTLDVGDRHVRVAGGKVARRSGSGLDGRALGRLRLGLGLRLRARARRLAPIDSIWICVSDARKPVCLR